MSISSVGGKSAYPTSSTDTRATDLARKRAESPETAAPTVADHVAALDEQEPIRSVSATRGTMVDTYL
jgi:hypothetical protein